MKHFGFRIACLFLLLPLASDVLAQAKSGLQAGVAAVEISPDLTPFQLRSGRSSYVHDPLFVRAIALENGSGRIVIALVDAIGVGREMADEAKAVAAKKTGWGAQEMLVCGTHTHSAPKGGDSSPGRIAYERKRRQGLADALVQSIESLQPAKIGYAKDAEPSEVYNRRWYLKPGTMDKNPFDQFDQVRTNAPRDHLLKPAGPTDPEVCVIDVRTRRGRPLGFIANYALHYVGGIPKVTEDDGRVVGMASADYFGEFARIMPYRIGGSNPPDDCVAMMTNAASGDINNIDFYRGRPPRAPFEQVRVVAGKAADAAWRAVKKIEDYDRDPLIAVDQREVVLKYRVPSAAEIDNANRLMALSRKEREAINRRTTQYAQSTLRMADPVHPETESVVVQAIRIGEQAIVSMPFEVFVEIGLEIKERSPFKHTFLIELANGGYGYLPTPEQHKLGGYETWLGTNKVQKDASEILTENLLEMLAELRELGKS